METLEQEFVYIHQEAIWQEANIRHMLQQAKTKNPAIIDRALTAMGNLLIRIGTKLKERAYTRLTTEEASAPSFLIML